MAEYHKLQKLDRLLAISGAPVSILRNQINRSMHQFLPISCQTLNPNNPKESRVITVNPHDQHQFQEQLFESTLSLGSAALYLIGSTNSETAASEALIELLRKFQKEQFEIKKVPEVKWFDLGNIDWAYMKSDVAPQIVIIQGLSQNSDNRRLELTNDIIRRFEIATLFVLIKTPNILDYGLNTLKVSPAGVLQFNSLVRKCI